MKNLAILDMVRFEPAAPGNLGWRLHKGSYRDDGSRIDDGSRQFDPKAVQKERHGGIITPDQNIDNVLIDVADYLKHSGYTLGDMSMLEDIAQREWNEDVLASRRARLQVNEIRLSRALKAVAFNLPDHPPQLGLQLSRIMIRPDGVVVVIDKTPVLLNAPDNVEQFISLVDDMGEKDDFGTLNVDDKALLKHVAGKVFQ